MRRLDVEGHSWLARLKLPRTIRALVFEALAEESGSPSVPAREESRSPSARVRRAAGQSISRA